MATYEITSPSGEAFEITAPDNASEAEVMSYFQQQFDAPQKAPEQSIGNQALRAAEFGARGMTDAGAEALGAIPELVSSGLRYVGDKTGLTLAPEEGYYPEVIKQGVKSVGQFISPDIDNFGPNTPQNTLERGFYGAGSGAVNAGAFMVPGLAASKLAQAGSVPQRVGQAIATQPGMQVAAGTVGGATEKASDSQLAGLAASLATPTLPALAKGAIKKAITPFASQLSANEKNLAQQAKDMGIKLTPGQETGSPGLRTMESTFGQLPFTASSQNAKYAGQRVAFNRAVLEKAGIKADAATGDVMDGAFKSIGKEYDNLIAKTDVNVDATMLDEVNAIKTEYSEFFGADARTKFNSVINKLSELKKAYQTPDISNVIIPGKQYAEATSVIKKLARSSTDSFEKEGLAKLVAAIDGAVYRSSGASVQKEWQNVNRRYANMKTIARALKGGTQKEVASGDIPISGLRQAVKQTARGEDSYVRGKGDLNDISRVGGFLNSAIPPDSGTARRTLMQGLLQGGSGGTMAGAATGDVTTAVAAAVAALGAPKLVQSLYNTRPAQAYFRNQVAQPTQGKLSEALLAKIAAANYLGAE
tara:strand:+ start:611 stop:2377 length:1767 start_codon:yes stop_codon:yes gene_type:complete